MPETVAEKQAILAYVPVIHRGYLQLFDEYKDASGLYIIDKNTMPEVDYLRKDLRSLDPAVAADLLSTKFENTEVFDKQKHLKLLDNEDTEIILPDEEISREAAKHFGKAAIKFHPVFLRWDRSSVEGVNKTHSDEVYPAKEFEKAFMKDALEAAGHSSDIWRRVGAVLVTKDGESQAATNRSIPDEQTPWIEGDPRNIFSRGVGIEMSLFAHAEASLIADAAKQGLSTEGSSLYVTDYPCPACAKLIALSGVDKLYYKNGYAVLDGARVLEDYGVKVYRIEVEDAKDEAVGKIPYVKRNAK